MTCRCHRMDCVTCDRFRLLSCWRKRTYTDPAAAIRAAGGDSTMTAYACVFAPKTAPHWHVGHIRQAARDEPEKLPRKTRQKEKA